MQKHSDASARPQNIMQAYRLASRQASAANNYDDKIRAYDKVINFCAHTDSCRFEPSVKRNMLLYWAYDKVGQAHLLQRHSDQALEYFKRGLVYAGSPKQKKAVLAKMALLYRKNGNVSGWLETRAELIGLLPAMEQLTEFRLLAAEYPDITGKAKVWERALQAAGESDLAVADKCNHVLAVCRKLLEIYNADGKTADWQRVKNLTDKTEQLAQEAGKLRALH